MARRTKAPSTWQIERERVARKAARFAAMTERELLVERRAAEEALFMARNEQCRGIGTWQDFQYEALRMIDAEFAARRAAGTIEAGAASAA